MKGKVVLDMNENQDEQMSRRRKSAPKDMGYSRPVEMRLYNCMFYAQCITSAALKNREVAGCNETCQRFRKTELRFDLYPVERDCKNQFERWS